MSEIRKVGISGYRKKRSDNGPFFNNRYKPNIIRKRIKNGLASIKTPPFKL